MTTRSVKELLADPAFREQLAKGIAEDIANRQRQRADFLRSETFTHMVAALRDNPNPVRVASEDIARAPDRVKTETGWTFASEADLQLFFDVLASPHADTVEAGSRTEDKDCMFDNCSFRHYGLHVWMMSGQGTVTTISNLAAVASQAA
jgi:hypothetical protein